MIGTKVELIKDLCYKTRVPEQVLNHDAEPSTCSVAQRMSWAAHRITTRVEDRAYSLMGLFGIHMPMFYGERDKAFLRLQQNIIQQSKDESLFAWDMVFPGNTRPYSGLFAPSPLVFANCSDIIQTLRSRAFSESHGELSVLSRISPHSSATYFVLLHCTRSASPDSRIFIFVGSTDNEGEYVRVTDAENISQGLIHNSLWDRFEDRLIRVPVKPTRPPNSYWNGFWLRTLQPPGHESCRTTILSNSATSNTHG